MKPMKSLLSALCASILFATGLHGDAQSVSTTGVVTFTVGDSGEQRIMPGMTFGSGTRFVSANDSSANFTVLGGATAFSLGASSSVGVQINDAESGTLDLFFGRVAADVNGGQDQVIRTMMGNIVASQGSKFTASLVYDAVSECAVLSITNIGGSVNYVALAAGEDGSIEPGTTEIIRVCEGHPEYAAIVEQLPAGNPITETSQAIAYYDSSLGGGATPSEELFAPLFTDDAALTIVSPELGPPPPSAP